MSTEWARSSQKKNDAEAGAEIYGLGDGNDFNNLLKIKTIFKTSLNTTDISHTYSQLLEHPHRV